MSNGVITLIRSGNAIVVSPTTREIRYLLEPELCYTTKVWLKGNDLRRAYRLGLPRVRQDTYEIFSKDFRERLVTSVGFTERVEKRLRASGYEVNHENLTPHPRPEIFVPNWNEINSRGELRYMQREVLEAIFKYPYGRIDCPPAYGKTHLIGLCAVALRKCKIAIIVRGLAALKQRIYPELCQMLPSVGLRCSGHRGLRERVMCISLDSLKSHTFDDDMVFVDECHLAAADRSAEHLAHYRDARLWGFSATHDMRPDNKDLRIEGLCGPIRVQVSFQDCVERGMVVPVEVHWRNVPMKEDPCIGVRDVAKQRAAIWANDVRNDIIAEDARQYDADTQVLIYVDKVEHAVHLKRRLPEFVLMYREGGMDEPDRWGYTDRDRYKQAGLIPENEPSMTVERREKITNAFTTGRLKKVICTTVWNAAVNFRDLAVVIRADGGGSPIPDTQVPGRAVRLGDKTDKKIAIVHDYRDEFNKGYRNKAGRRRTSYEGHGWVQVFIDRRGQKTREGTLWASTAEPL